jgi:hypothetical protein
MAFTRVTPGGSGIPVDVTNVELISALGNVTASLSQVQLLPSPEVSKEGILYANREGRAWSTRMKEWGYDPLPQHREPPESPVSTPELYKEYPYILITGALTPLIPLS